MIAEAAQQAILPASVPTLALAAGFLAAAASWVGLHRLKARLAWRQLRWAAALACLAAGFATLQLAADLALRGMLLTTSWRLWPLALGGAAGVEVLLALYGLERRTVSRRAGLALAGLRVALALLVVAMLAQPVLSWELVEELRRHVAVLVDVSASMHVKDPQRSPAEKLRLAERLGLPVARRQVRLEDVAGSLEALRSGLVAAGDDLAGLAGAENGTRAKQLAARRGQLRRTLSEARMAADRHVEAVGAAMEARVPLDEAARNALRDAKAQLVVGVRDRLAEALRILEDSDEARLAGSYDQLVAAIRGTTAALAKSAATLPSLGEACDAAAYAALSDDQRRQIDAAVDKTRLELAREVLLRPAPSGDANGAGESLLERLEKGYKVRIYEFAESCAEAGVPTAQPAPGASTAPAGAPAATTSPASPVDPAAARQTDIAKAIEKAATELAGKQLAGIILLSEGRHNGPRRLEPLATQLGLQRVPICPVVMAPDRPPRDAAVISVEAPQTVAEGDRFLLDAELKLDGLAGQSVLAALFDGDRRIGVQTVIVPKDAASHRAAVQFSDEPKGAGLHTYAVRIAQQPDEVFPANNDYPLTVSVTKERVKLLVMEGRPRWEFRYLKNLFADRDRNVQLQYVLTAPDHVAGQPQRPPTPASASRGRGQEEASAPPANAREWMKFDVVVLGDVAPAALGAEHTEAIAKFVIERGGTLIVVAGPNHMPHAFGDTPLAEVLPAVFRPSDQPAGGQLRTGFRIALTGEGAAHTIMSQHAEAAASAKVWQAVPEVFWRHPTAAAKEGTTVLAYAMPPSPPEFLQPLPPDKAGDEKLLLQRETQQRRFQQENALISLHNVGAGRVMMLHFDSTWRLRYRVGDTYHHRFWGQVMRWATSDKLRAGTEFVRLGTDRTRYGPGEPVRLKAKLLQADLTPLVSQAVHAALYAGDRPILRKKLEFQQGSAGFYEAVVESLPSGTYRVELEAPEAEPLLAMDKVRRVVTEFSVDPVGTAEEVELSADRGLLKRLAALSGGAVADAHQPEQVLAALGPAGLVRRETRELRLWDSWPLLAAILLLATIEWTLRKRVGLA